MRNALREAGGLLLHYETHLLTCVIIVLFAARFSELATMPFIFDEPMVQTRIDAHLARGTVPVTGLMSTRGVAYGPTSQWGFFPARWFTADIPPVAALNIAYFGIAFLLLYLAARRTLDDRAAAWATALAAASPYFFFYSRLLWETTFLIFTSALLLYAVARSDESPPRKPWLWLWLGAGIGLAVNTHLLMMPIIAATLLMIIAAWRRTPDSPPRAWHVLLGIAACACIVGPYLWAVWPSLSARPQMQWNGAPLATLPLQALHSLVKYLSFEGMEYFVDVPRQRLDLLVWRHPQIAILASTIGWIVAFVALGTAVAYIQDLYRRRSVPVMAQYGGLALAGVLVFYLGTRPDLSHPHYLSSIWWLPFFLVAAGIHRLRGRWQLLLKAVAAGCIVVNVLFLLSAQAYIRANLGTRGPHYGTAQAVIRDAILATCVAMSQGQPAIAYVDLRAVPGVLPPSIQYFSAHVPACQGKRLVVSAPPVAYTGMVAEFHYPAGSTTDAALQVRVRSVK